jgi:hypothetical protein
VKYKKYKLHISSLWALLIVVFVCTIFIPNPIPIEANVIGDGFAWVIKAVLIGFITFLSLLSTMAGSLIAYVIDAESFNAVMSQPAIQESWKLIRDIFNLAFILVLLFSAFATIFQIEKYHIKKIILLLIIMALLVNFSFPISRFVIDAANIPMYWLAQNIFGGGGNQVSTQIGEITGIGPIVTAMEASDANLSFAQLFSVLIFLFIFLVTLLALAFMFLIRTIVLILLVIFSPLGFVAAIFPSTKNYADDYWQALFKNAFFGPIMMLVLAICIKVVGAFQGADFVDLDTSEINTSQSGSANELAQWAFFFVPVVLLWGGMIWSQKLGAVGADVVMKKADDFARRSWGGLKPAGKIVSVGGKTVATGANFATGGFTGRVSDRIKSVPLGFKKAYIDDKKEARKEQLDRYTRQSAGHMPWGGKNATLNPIRSTQIARRDAREANINERMKRNEDEKRSTSQLIRDLESRNIVTRLAATRQLAKDKNISTGNELSQAITAAQQDPETLNQILKNTPKEVFADLNANQQANIADIFRTTRLELHPYMNDEDVNRERNKLQTAFRGKLSEKRNLMSSAELVQTMTSLSTGVDQNNQAQFSSNDINTLLNNAPNTALRGLDQAQTTTLLENINGIANVQERDQTLRNFQSKMRDAGNILTFTQASNFDQGAMNNLLSRMNQKQMAQQGASFFENASVRNYVNNQLDMLQRQALMDNEEMSLEKIRALENQQP